MVYMVHYQGYKKQTYGKQWIVQYQFNNKNMRTWIVVSFRTDAYILTFILIVRPRQQYLNLLTIIITVSRHLAIRITESCHAKMVWHVGHWTTSCGELFYFHVHVSNHKRQ